MKKLLIIVSTLVAVMALSCFNANALLISGDGFLYTVAPGSVVDDSPGATNTAIEAFNEAQDVLLGLDLAGSIVNSHMIFLNTAIGSGGAAIANSESIFDGDIIGVMSDRNGSLETASSSLLGAAGVVSPSSGFNYRGLEGPDGYSTSGNTIAASRYVSEPGDWIRIITSSPVPEPATMILFGTGLLGLVGFANRKKK